MLFLLNSLPNFQVFCEYNVCFIVCMHFHISQTNDFSNKYCIFDTPNLIFVMPEHVFKLDVVNLAPGRASVV